MKNAKMLINIMKLTKLSLKSQLIGFIFVLLYSATVLLSPAASGYLVDRILVSKNISDMMVGVCFFCLSIICQPIIGFFKDTIYMNIILELNSYNSLLLFKKILYAPMDFFDKMKKGEVISKLTNDTKEISSFISNFFSTLIKDLILTVLIMLCMFLISAKITTIVLLLLIIFFAINQKLNNKLEKLSMKIAENNDLQYSQITQILSSIVSIKCFCNEERVIDNYKNTLDKMRKANKSRNILAIIIRNFGTLVIMVSLSFIYLLGCIDVLNGKMSVGNIISMGLYYQLIMSPLFEIVGCIIDINNIKPIFQRFNEIEFLNTERRQGDSGSINKLKYVNDIHLEHVTFGYHHEVVLNDICLDTPAKGYIGIIGRSGEGKSTLMKLLMGFYDPNCGKISIGDVNVCKLGSNDLREKIAFVSQDIMLFPSSFLDNFMYVNKELTYQEIVNLCKKVNMHEKIMSTDQQYRTLISETSNISGGEKQRLGIAMALAKKSSIILLDEPTSALDPDNEKRIVQLLKELSKEKLVIVISHKEDTLKCSDKVYSLQKGKLTEVILNHIMASSENIPETGGKYGLQN